MHTHTSLFGSISVLSFSDVIGHCTDADHGNVHNLTYTGNDLDELLFQVVVTER